MSEQAGPARRKRDQRNQAPTSEAAKITTTLRRPGDTGRSAATAALLVAHPAKGALPGLLLLGEFLHMARGAKHPEPLTNPFALNRSPADRAAPVELTQQQSKHGGAPLSKT